MRNEPLMGAVCIAVLLAIFHGNIAHVAEFLVAYMVVVAVVGLIICATKRNRE